MTQGYDGEREERWSRELANLRAETERQRVRLVTLSRLGQHIASSLELPIVSQHVVDSACELTGARYGALGVFDEAGQITEFVTHGLSEDERHQIGKLPEGLGILGWLQELQEPLRLADLTSHPRSAGFPPGHPPMKTFLGAPIRHGPTSLGNLYLTEKAGGVEFTPEDEDLLTLFTAQAAMAIRNAQLYRQVQDFVVLEERDRIGMDLHDGVIQSLYGAGLRLENCLEDIGTNDHAAREQLSAVVDSLNQVITDVRNYVFDLRPDVLKGDTLVGALTALLDHVRLNDGVAAELQAGSDVDEMLDEVQVTAFYLIAHEAITNARKHANAARVVVRIDEGGDTLCLHIEDDGAGFDPTDPWSGDGLRNMRDRVRQLGGVLDIESGPGNGTCLEARIPLSTRP